jgi:hypothetical protein
VASFRLAKLWPLAEKLLATLMKRGAESRRQALGMAYWMLIERPEFRLFPRSRCQSGTGVL